MPQCQTLFYKCRQNERNLPHTVISPGTTAATKSAGAKGVTTNKKRLFVTLLSMTYSKPGQNTLDTSTMTRNAKVAP